MLLERGELWLRSQLSNRALGQLPHRNTEHVYVGLAIEANAFAQLYISFAVTQDLELCVTVFCILNVMAPFTIKPSER